MKNPFKETLAYLAADIERFDQEILLALAPQKPYLTEVEYDIYTKGKRLRPIILLLAARLGGNCPVEEELPIRVIKAATSLEMLHVATLIHDDIIDKAPKRRGSLSVNEARGSDIALLVGDMQFVNAVRCFASAIETQEDMHLVQTVLDVGFKICCGELDEIMTDPNWSTERLKHRYIRTIDRKTAILIELACESGATLMKSRKRAIWKLGRYGRLLGRAFQMMDDLRDFTESEDESGKVRGIDLMMRRPTLPIIYAMEELGDESRVARIIRGEEVSDAEMELAINDVMFSDGFQKAYKEVRNTIREALVCLDFFPESKLRRFLEDIANYVVNKGFVSSEVEFDPKSN